ncbi:MAG: HTH-type transcriptional regulator CdhR [Pseudomonas citronellolis]|nr:MAG: HTH-type transcriptional regulator CdhR [Pseudomonas citronellolis]
MTRASPQAFCEIGVLVYPGAQAAAVQGLTDLFAIAERLAGEQAAGQFPRLRVSHWRLDDEGRAPQRLFDSQPEAPSAALAAVVVPPSLFGVSEETPVAPLGTWLRQRHAEGAVIAAVCVGAQLVAASGLLDGRSATVHASGVTAFAARHPQVRLEAHRPIVDDGDLITSAGLMAWSDLGLRLVERLLAPGIAAATARFMSLTHSEASAQCGAHFAPHLGHGDLAILRVQHWLQGNGAVAVDLDGMAACAGLERRTLLRRFRAATGLKPTEYCQHLRVGRAREMLEYSRTTVEQIGWRVGYQDAATFRATFRKLTGLSPSEYRRRFGAMAASEA